MFIGSSPNSRPRLWTVMIYLAGDNNLETYGVKDLLEIKAVGSTRDVAVVAQFDRMSDQVTRRYYLTPNYGLDADCVAQLPEANTGDPASLLDFIRWGLTNYRANHTALILWNHGAGWKDDDIYALMRHTGLSAADLPRSHVRGLGNRTIGRSLFATSIKSILRYPPQARAILFDDTSKDFLDNQELKCVLDTVLGDRNGQKLDLIGFDACLMNMIEVAAQVHQACDFMVGSQEVEPADGWPYTSILTALMDNPQISADALARVIVDSYANHYIQNPAHMAVTQSAARLQNIPMLAQNLGRLADSLVEYLPDALFFGQVLLPAVRHAQKFRDKQYVDLRHLTGLLGERAGDSPIGKLARAVADQLDPATPNPVIVATQGLAPELVGSQQGKAIGQGTIHAGGLSIYLPLFGAISPAYAELEFARHCSWGKFLEAFLET